MPRSSRRVLLVTLPVQILGGVGSKALFLARHLARHGHRVSLAYYAARSLRPDLNASLLGTMVGGQGAIDHFVDDEGFAHHVVGTRFPAFEDTYTAGSENWNSVFEDYDRFVAVGGSPVIAHPLVRAGRKHFLWCADDLHGDRESRLQAGSALRRVADHIAVEGKLIQQQDAVLQGSNAIRGVSGYTVSRLLAHGAVRPEAVARLPIPVDLDYFAPPPVFKSALRIGFAGRMGDPRKNAPLLFEGLGELRRQGIPASLHIAGPLDSNTQSLARQMGLADHIAFLGVLDRSGLRTFFQELDAFVLPSTREGLAIAGLEAMACGTPLVSTRSGGPEDYVIDDETGYLTGSTAADLAGALARIIGDAKIRERLSLAGRDKVEREFSEAAFSRLLDVVWRDVWQERYQEA